MIDHTPKVFISYNQTSDSYKQEVRAIASRLMSDRIDVVLDQWELREGQDLYSFMEEWVSSDEIDRVLILSDKRYAEKADDREGGVGAETTIITPSVYKNAKQTRFIPMVMERDMNGEPYLPVYLKSKNYRDLSGDEFEQEYELLVRAIYEAPLYQKPELGIRPTWLDGEAPATLYPLKSHNRGKTTIQVTLPQTWQDYLDVYVEALKPFYKQQYHDKEEYLTDFQAMKAYRDAFLLQLHDFSNQNEFGETLADGFERLYNELYQVHTFNPESNQEGPYELDIFRLHIWELFVTTVAFLLHYERYHDIYRLLYHTYFLRIYGITDEVRPFSYDRFRFHSTAMEEWIKPEMSGDLSRKYTLTGHFVCAERECRPLYTGKSIANADLFLYQVYNAIGLEAQEWRNTWFPTCYVYADGNKTIWAKLKSNGFCNKIMPLFGLDNNTDELKSRISRCKAERDVRYSVGYARPATAILDLIKEDEIGILP